mmetsp:Transcript_7317/g.20534  ORF Transcript_7317/g.20534 Transcript_7317/m.20534 type:complete len:291 (+) Transcript_7317:499-1371(+)
MLLELPHVDVAGAVVVEAVEDPLEAPDIHGLVLQLLLDDRPMVVRLARQRRLNEEAVQGVHHDEEEERDVEQEEGIEDPPGLAEGTCHRPPAGAVRAGHVQRDHRLRDGAPVLGDPGVHLPLVGAVLEVADGGLHEADPEHEVREEYEQDAPEHGLHAAEYRVHHQAQLAERPEDADHPERLHHLQQPDGPEERHVGLRDLRGRQVDHDVLEGRQDEQDVEDVPGPVGLAEEVQLVGPEPQEQLQRVEEAEDELEDLHGVVGRVPALPGGVHPVLRRERDRDGVQEDDDR